MRKVNKKNYCKLKKGNCFLGCKDYKNSDCPGYYSTIVLPNGVKINIPLYNEFYNNYFEEIIMKIKKNGCITKQEVFQILKEKYKLDISPRVLQYYVDRGLIGPGVKEGFPGVTGSVSFYDEKTPGQIHVIQELIKKRNITLEEIKKYKDIIYEFKEDVLACYLACYFPNYKNIDKSLDLEIDGIERSKFRTAIKFFAFAESVIKFKSVILPLIYPIYKDKKIKEIRVIIKDWSKRVTYNSIEDINTRLRAQRILGVKDGVIDSPEELNSLRNLKTIKEVIFSKDKIEVL